MLKQVSLLDTCARYAMPSNPQPLDKGMYVFPNCETGALMGLEYPLAVEQQVKMLLRHAHKERELARPLCTLHGIDAAKRLGISQRVLQRWVKKGWIYCWTNWLVVLFSELEVEALRLAKPRDL